MAMSTHTAVCPENTMSPHVMFSRRFMMAVANMVRDVRSRNGTVPGVTA